ncbi:MAG: glycosyl hydrolase [Candidatus Micrarchaeaceae archaeon]
MHKSAIIAIIIIVVIAVLAVSYLVYKAGTGRQSQAAFSNRTYSQKFCVNAVQNASAMQEALANGITCFRTDIALNSSKEDYVSNITNEGGQFLGILDYETVGAQPSPSGCVSGCNWTLADWNASVYNAVLDYPEVDEWEIWNEPLVLNFASGYENGSALDYYDMIKSAYLIIKKNDPNSTVVCFGGAELYPFSYVQQEYAFYSAVWGYGASQYCDAISLHAYTGASYDLNQSIGGATVYDEYNYTLNLYENLTNKPIWITETGIPSNNWTTGINLSEQKQASFIVQDMEFFGNYSFVKRVYWFNLEDGGSGPDYGLLGANANPKPSWNAFLHFVGNSTKR